MKKKDLDDICEVMPTSIELIGTLETHKKPCGVEYLADDLVLCDKYRDNTCKFAQKYLESQLAGNKKRI